MQEHLHKLRILVTARHPVGGIRTFMRYVYGRFDRQKYQFIFILPLSTELATLKKDLHGVDAKWITIDPQKSIQELLKEIWRNIHKADIVHSHGFTAMILSSFPALLSRKPHIFTSHDVLNEKQFLNVKGRLKKLILGICLHMPDRLHSVSHDAQENLLSFFPGLREKSNRLVIVPNGIDIERFCIEDRINWHKELALPKDTFLIGFFGRFMSQKGFRFLVEAIEILSRDNSLISKPLVLAFGQGGFVREEQALIREKHLESFFCFLPFQENPAKAMRGVDVIAMPSLWEAYGLVAAEAMVAGVPIIGTDCIGLREVLRETPAKIIPSANSKALAEAVVTEMRHPTKLEFERFRKDAATRFSANHTAIKLQTIINSLWEKEYMRH